MSQIIVIGLIALALFFFFKLWSKFKRIKIGALSIITGGVKCGKSTLSCYLVKTEYRKRLFQVKFANFFRKIFRKELKEIPLIYSNVPLACDYVPITYDLISRKKVRFAYKSVIYIQEASLFADSRLIDDKTQNTLLMMFNKLIGHETKGGCLIYDTQNIGDLHYSIKRSISNYIYIHSLTKLPFFVIAHCRELLHNEDGDISNNINSDLEDNLKHILIPKSIWKMFDAYCYSCLTDNLPVEKNVVHNKDATDLKCKKIISFRPEYNIEVKESDFVEKLSKITTHN